MEPTLLHPLRLMSPFYPLQKLIGQHAAAEGGTSLRPLQGWELANVVEHHGADRTLLDRLPLDS